MEGGYHCKQKAGISHRIPSHMCGSWYLPRFLFRGVINPSEHCFHCGLGDALGLPAHDGEAVQFDGMICGVGMVINGGWGPKMFLVSVPEGSASFTDVFRAAP